MKIFHGLLFLIFSPTLLLAQDYFDDFKGTGLGVLTGKTGNTILTTRVNIGDNSIKINFFQQYRINPVKQDAIIDLDSMPDLPPSSLKYDIGWGAYIKGKSENGIASIFSTGSFVPGFDGNFYLSLRNLRTDSLKVKNDQGVFKKQPVSRWWVILLSGGYTFAKYNLYDPSAVFQNQLTDTIFQSFNMGLSGLYILPVNRTRTDNLILGGSMVVSKVSNYGSLKKVEIKDITIDTSAIGVIRQITKANGNSLYGEGDYKEFTNARLRFNVAYIPKFLNYRVAVIFYPSISMSEIYNPRYNTGISIQFLKEGSPTISIGGIYVEFNDVTNVMGRGDSFIKRSMTVGLTGSINIMKQD